MIGENQSFTLNHTQRTRINIDYSSSGMKFGFQLQDVRAWGDDAQLVLNDGAKTTVHQAWGEILFTNNFSLKIGRMELVYDDQRILGNVNWTQQARSHDLALFKYQKPEDYQLHFGLAINQTNDHYYNTPGNYKSMQFLWFHKKMNDYSLSLLFLNNGLQNDTIGGKPISTVYSQTIGQHSEYKTGNFNLSVNTYYQMGKNTAVYSDNSGIQNKKISAFNIGLDGSYKISSNLNAGVGYEILSGNDQTDLSDSYNQVVHSFVPLYGTNHKFNGWMDYFYVSNHINSVGLQDYYLDAIFKKNEVDFGLTIHQFFAASSILDKNDFVNNGNITSLTSGLGTEIDFSCGYKFSDEVNLKAGVSLFLPTSSFFELRNGNPNASNYFGWVMFIFKPKFI